MTKQKKLRAMLCTYDYLVLFYRYNEVTDQSKKLPVTKHVLSRFFFSSISFYLFLVKLRMGRIVF